MQFAAGRDVQRLAVPAERAVRSAGAVAGAASEVSKDEEDAIQAFQQSP